jgi:hypothetical protein
MSRAACWSAFGAAAIAMSWPMVIASVVLRYAFVRSYVVNEAAIVAYPTSVCVAALGAVLSTWRPPEDDAAWVIRCSLLGAVVADIWLALGAYFHAQEDVAVFARTLLGGVLYAMPVGLAVGVALGLEIVGLRRWAQRFQGTHQVERFVGISVVANFVVAAILRWATRHAGAGR